MKIPLQITFRNMPPSEAIESHIREKAAKLESFYDRIMGCRVVVEAPHRRHHKGKAYLVRIDLTVPGGELVVNREPTHLEAEKPEPLEPPEKELAECREPTREAAHEDPYVAIRDAFNAAARKLQDFARRQRGKVKRHEPPPRAVVVKLFPEEDYGFLESADGREIYFHRNSVLPPGFDRLKVGTPVYFHEEPGEKGPQASTVRIAAR
ncbi:MAG TPA: HPF/RaiA family ribosome-associated protein [candidate division Zixibacteria bacterium]|nr:HPF/RaiA family ribosome-associated protein [candidate division Zixibacteria bacterium]